MTVSKKYIRQLSLPEVGIEGQKKISETKILIIGAGGLGVPACLYLASSGIGYLGILDGDIIEESNLARQVLYSKNDIGQKKVEILCEKISYLNPETKICSYDIWLTEQNAKSIFGDYDLVINGSDNFKTRYLINKYAVELEIPWVDAAVLKFSGQISYFLPRQGCYNCLFPSAQESVANCNNEGILAPLCGMFGSWAAVNALKIILGLVDNNNAFFEFNAQKNQIKHFKWNRRDDCSICKLVGPAVKPRDDLHKPRDDLHKPRDDLHKPRDDKTSKPAARRIGFKSLTHLSDFTLVDLGIFSTVKKEIPFIENKIEASFADFFSKDLEDPLFIQQHGKKEQTYVFVCEAGLKSRIAAEILVDEGYNAYCLDLSINE